MKGIFRLLSSICRQFLVGLARVAGGSSRESVSTLVETCPVSQPAFARCSAGPLSLRPTRNADSQLMAGIGVSVVRTALKRHEGTPKSYRFVRKRPRPFGNPLSKRQGAEASAIDDILRTVRKDCALHTQEAANARRFTIAETATLLQCSNIGKPRSPNPKSSTKTQSEGFRGARGAP